MPRVPSLLVTSAELCLAAAAEGPERGLGAVVHFGLPGLAPEGLQIQKGPQRASISVQHPPLQF